MAQKLPAKSEYSAGYAQALIDTRTYASMAKQEAEDFWLSGRAAAFRDIIDFCSVRPIPDAAPFEAL